MKSRIAHLKRGEKEGKRGVFDALSRDVTFSRRGNGTKRGGGFSHVAVRSCASRGGKCLVRVYCGRVLP